MNIPNILSLLRIFMVAPFLVAVIYRQFTIALVIFVISGISDFLDGYIARRLGETSVLGTFLDPLGDKLLTTVAFVSLCFQGLLPPWLTVTVVAKDIYIVIGAGILYFSGNFSVAVPSFWGKVSTFLQIISVCVALSSTFWSIDAELLDGLYAVTGLVTVIAFFHYIWCGVKVFSENTTGNGQS